MRNFDTALVNQPTHEQSNNRADIVCKRNVELYAGLHSLYKSSTPVGTFALVSQQYHVPCTNHQYHSTERSSGKRHGTPPALIATPSAVGAEYWLSLSIASSQLTWDCHPKSCLLCIRIAMSPVPAWSFLAATETMALVEKVKVKSLRPESIVYTETKSSTSTS